MAQEWICEDGKRTIMARPMNTGCNGFGYMVNLSVLKANMVVAIGIIVVIYMRYGEDYIQRKSCYRN